MALKDWISIVTPIAPTVIAIISLLFSWFLFKGQNKQQLQIVNLQNEHEKQRRQLDQELERRRQEIERTYAPHIQFSIDCKFYGPENDYYLAEFLVSAHNKGNVRQEFRREETPIRLRVRGIEAEHALSEWRDHEPRLEFPQSLVDNVQIIPNTLNFFFIEPGVEQIFTYVIRLPSSIKYILATASFWYDPYTPHATERVFQMRT